MNKQPAPAGPASGRIEFLDFAKGCAMLSIVLFHYFRGYFPGLGDKAVMVGGAGVHLFLLLSGFGLALSTQRLAASFFYRKRFSRILLPYFLVVTLIFALNQFIPLYPGSGLYAWLGHILLFKMFDESIINSFGGHFWFLSTIIQFYLVYPLLDRCLRTMDNNWFALSGLAISMGYWLLLACTGMAGLRVGTSFFLQYLWEFCGGMVLARLFVARDYRFWQQQPIFLLLAGLVGLGLMGAMALKGGTVGKVFNDIPSAIGYTSLVAFLYTVLAPSSQVGTWLRKGLLFTGSISYEIYLTHMLIFSIFSFFMAGGDVNTLSLSGRLAAIPVAFGTATLFNRLLKRSLSPR